MAARKREADPELSAAEKEFDVEDKSVKPDKSGGVDIDLDDAEDADRTPAETPESRQDRRKQRKAILDENERLRNEAAEARAAAQHAAGFAQGLSQRVQAPSQAQENPLDTEEKSLQAEMDRLVNESNMLERAKGTPEQFADLKKRAWEFDQRKSAFLLKKAGGGQQQGVPKAVIDRMQLEARYPDVMADERVFQWANLEYNKRLLKGMPNTWENRDMVADLAREEFGLRPQQQRHRRSDDAAMRQKLTGTPKGGTGAPDPQTNTVRLSDKQVDEARAAYPHLPEKQALAKYAKGLVRGQRA